MRYLVEALHPMSYTNGIETRTISREDLERIGSSLSGKWLSINHGEMHLKPREQQPQPLDWNTLETTPGEGGAAKLYHSWSIPPRLLRYPENQCLDFAYNSETNSVQGEIEVTDEQAITLIENRTIRWVSVQLSHELDMTPASIDGLSLLTGPGLDRRARIIGKIHELPATISQTQDGESVIEFRIKRELLIEAKPESAEGGE